MSTARSLGIMFALILLTIHSNLLLANSSGRSGVRRVLIVVLENTNVDKAMAQPFLKSLQKKGATLNDYHAIGHPSEPNYIAMIAGSEMGVADDVGRSLEGKHLGDLLEEKGLSWKVYAEDYPGNCFAGERYANYARKHNPFMQFANVLNDSKRCRSHVVSADNFDKDVQSGNLPEFAMYIPNLRNDGHDTSIGFADKWLGKKFAAKLEDPQFLGETLFVVTFDENDARIDSDNNRILTVVLGQVVKSGVISQKHYTHYHLLRTVEDVFKLGTLGRQDTQASPIDDIWKDTWSEKQFTNSRNTSQSFQ